jgi:hypothetical protein
MRAALDLRLGKIRGTMATKAELAEAKCEALKWMFGASACRPSPSSAAWRPCSGPLGQVSPLSFRCQRL